MKHIVSVPTSKSSHSYAALAAPAPKELPIEVLLPSPLGFVGACKSKKSIWFSASANCESAVLPTSTAPRPMSLATAGAVEDLKP